MPNPVPTWEEECPVCGVKRWVNQDANGPCNCTPVNPGGSLMSETALTKDDIELLRSFPDSTVAVIPYTDGDRKAAAKKLPPGLVRRDREGDCARTEAADALIAAIDDVIAGFNGAIDMLIREHGSCEFQEAWQPGPPCPPEKRRFIIGSTEHEDFEPFVRTGDLNDGDEFDTPTEALIAAAKAAKGEA